MKQDSSFPRPETNGESTADADVQPEEAGSADARFPIVGVGASAGGLNAFQRFFDSLPAQPGMAFVLVQHLAPDHESELPELLQTHTQLKVAQVTEETEVKPNGVYVIPPGKSLSINRSVLHLSAPEQPHGQWAPIDLFFRSLAEDQGEHAVCVILSGTGSDGSLGLKAIKEHGGITMAQAPEDAEYDGMPKSAIATGLVDLTGTAEELAKKLVSYRQSAEEIDLPNEEEALPEDAAEALQRIFVHLREATGHDFANYKRSTILRRIERRLHVNHKETVPAYFGFMRDNPEEQQALFKDFLISVTNFFRDPEAFKALEENVIPTLFESKGRRDTVRVWVAGCATGEEAYSLAMLLCEYASGLDAPPSLQVFATDLDEEALAFARRGHYTGAIETDVSPERLQRFFVREGGGYQVKEEVREIVLFAPHNLIKDAPFSRLDMVSCRNLLIYLDREVQEKVIEVFHYALGSGGFLFLGSSESIGTDVRLFETFDKKRRLFRRSSAAISPPRLPALPIAGNGKPNKKTPPDEEPEESVEERYHARSLRRYAPPRLLVDESHEITHVFGAAGRYLQDREGPATHNVLERITDSLRPDLRAALYQAKHKEESSQSRPMQIDVEGTSQVVRLHVEPLKDDGFPPGYVEIVFLEIDPDVVEALSATVEAAEGEEDPLVARLEDELQDTRKHLQTTIEEYETTTEELKASNEELQSTNEELQSTTEELETGREELQSTNEELITVNQELKNKLEELNRSNSDLQNLMASTEIGTLFLDRELCVKRFTPRVTDLFHVIPSDVGRPFSHVSHKIDGIELTSLAEQVLERLDTVEEELQSKDKRWFIVRMFPYRTVEDKIDGVVITFVEVTKLKRAEQELAERARKQAAVAELGQIALKGTPLDDLMQTTTQRVADILGAELCKVLELTPDGETLRLRAGVGWKEGYVGEAAVANDQRSQAGYTLVATEPVVVEDFSKETRFVAPSLLTEHGVRSGMSTIIHGVHQPYGVLGVHSLRRRPFTEDDARFLQAVANVLAEAIERTQSEADVRQHAAVLEAVIESMPDAVYIGNEAGTTQCNEVGLRMIGADSLEDLQGRTEELAQKFNVRWATSGEPLEAGDYPFLRALHGEVAIEDLLAINVQTGEDLFLRSAAAPIRVDGEIVGAVGINTDITHRIRTERALREREETLRLAVEAARLGVWSRNLATDEMTFDEQSRQLFGMEPEMAYEEAWRSVHPEDVGDVERALKGALDPASDGSYAVEHRIVLPGGGTRWLAVQGQCYFADGPEGHVPHRLIGVARDVTGRRAMEETIRQQLAEIEAYYLSAPVGLCFVDRERRYVRINQQLAEINGMSVEEHLGKRPGELFPDLIGKTDPLVQQVLSTGQPILNAEQSIAPPSTPDEERFWLLSYYPFKDEAGAVLGVNIVVQEVTELRQTVAALREHERELKEVNEDLEARVQERTQQVRRLASDLTLAEQRERRRIAQVLHDDLQQLLYGVQVKLQMLAKNSSEKTKEQQVAALEDLIDRSIQTSRTLTVNLSPPVLEGEGLDQSVEWLALQMEDVHGLEVDVETIGSGKVPGRDLHVLLFQLIRELLFNVVKHAETSKAQVQLRSDDEMLTILVKDEGRGFDPETVPGPKGLELTSGDLATGLGLFSIRERLRAVGGMLEIESAPGRGTHVTIRLPLQAFPSSY
ncbi:MAG: chemotaxis protein CheB [Rhodothermales bacterium]